MINRECHKDIFKSFPNLDMPRKSWEKNKFKSRMAEENLEDYFNQLAAVSLKILGSTISNSLVPVC